MCHEIQTSEQHNWLKRTQKIQNIRKFVRRLDTIKRFATALGNTTAALVVREDGVTFTLKIATRIYRPSSQRAQEISRFQPHDSAEFEAEAPTLNVPKRHSPPNTRADKPI
jgi:hypothetical protein